MLEHLKMIHVRYRFTSASKNASLKDHSKKGLFMNKQSSLEHQNHHIDASSLMKDMGLDEAEILHRKEWLQFNKEDEARLTELNDMAQGYADEVIESLYDHFLSFEETKKFFEDPNVLKRVKNLQKEYFLRLTKGNYDSDYIEERLKIGAVHASIGLDVKWYLGAYNFYTRAVAKRLFEAFKDNPDKALAAFFSLSKLFYMDIGLAIDTYIYQRELTIKKQQQAIRELSTPVLQLREELLILPIIGAIDAQRARQLTEQLLHAIRDKRAKVVVIDITGVPTVDSRVANHLVQTVDATRLMGATLIITGLSAEVAQTLVTIGVDLSKITTVGDLQGGIEEATRIIDQYKIKPQSDAMHDAQG
jgi:rsbT co-antagonist protein RsbR